MTDVSFPNAVTSTPSLGQIVGTSLKADGNHKVRYFFMMCHGDPIGHFYSTQALEVGMMVNVAGHVHPVSGFSIDPEDGLCAELEAAVN